MDMMESFATPYPIYYSDGEQEKELGTIGIHSVLTYRHFQTLIAQKTGIQANNLSAVFVCRKTSSQEDKKQRLPINENTNFCILLNQHSPSKERDAHFLITPKRSKKERKGGQQAKRRGNSTSHDNASEDSADPDDHSGPDEGPVPLSRPSASTSSAAAREAAMREREKLNAAHGRGQSNQRGPSSSSSSRGAGLASSSSARPTPTSQSASTAPAGGGQQTPHQGHGPAGQQPPGRAPAPQPQAQPQAQLQPQAQQVNSQQEGLSGFAKLQIGPEPNKVCKVCTFCKENNTDPPFHCCPNDKVVIIKSEARQMRRVHELQSSSSIEN